MKCPHCKAKIEKGSKFCEKCGRPVQKKKFKKVAGCFCVLVVPAGVLTGIYFWHVQNQKTAIQVRDVSIDSAQIDTSVLAELSIPTEIPIPTETPIPTKTPIPTEVPAPTKLPEEISTSIPAPTTEPIVTSIYANTTQEEKIQHIRDIYYDTQANLDYYRLDSSQPGMQIYYDGDILKKIVSVDGACSNEEYFLPQGYSAEFFYDNNTFLFAFVYEGTEEYRFYADPDNEMKCIRYIGPDGIVQDFESSVFSSEQFGEMGKFCEAGYTEPYWLSIKVTG